MRIQTLIQTVQIQHAQSGQVEIVTSDFRNFTCFEVICETVHRV